MPSLTSLLMAISAQMFIGEMGCWIVIFISYMYHRYVSSRFSHEPSPLLAGGYHPVSADDRGYDDDEDQTLDGPPVDGHNSKPSVSHDGRIHLQGRRIFLLAAPACCDLTATTLMNVGLLFVAASIYQMTRGALVLFVGLFSVLFLRRKLYAYQWAALFVVVLGVALVGLAGALFGGDSNKGTTQENTMEIVSNAMMQARDVAQTPEAVKAVIGVLLIAAAQIFTASQFVLEEWILENYEMDPIRVVGWEGIFGFVVTIAGMIILYLAVGRTESGRYGYFDAKEGWHQVFTNRAVIISSIFIMISIGCVSPPASNRAGKTNFQFPQQWLQLLRPISNPLCFSHFPQHNRYLPYAFYLARFFDPRLGVI